MRTARRVYSRAFPSLRTTGLRLPRALDRPLLVVWRCPHCSRAHILHVVDGLPTSTPDGSDLMPPAVVILLWGSRSLLLSHTSGRAGDGKDCLATGKATLVLHHT